MDSPNLINKKIEVGLFIIENCYNNFLLKTQIEGKNPSYKISRDEVKLFDPFEENDSTTENVEVDPFENNFIPDPPSDEPIEIADPPRDSEFDNSEGDFTPPTLPSDLEPIEIADPPPDDKAPKIARRSSGPLSKNRGKTFEVKVVPIAKSTPPLPPAPNNARIIKTTKEAPVEVTEEKEIINEILNEVILIAEDEFALQFETVSENIETVKLAEERIKDYIENGILWEGSAEFEIIDTIGEYLLFSDLLNTINYNSLEFNWGAAFIAFCYKDFIKKEIRKTYMASTYRFKRFAEGSQRYFNIQSLIKKTSEKVQKNIFQISNNEKLSQEEKTEQINIEIAIVKKDLNKVFLKGYIVSMLPTQAESWGTNFGIIYDGKVYAQIIDPETEEISETGDGDLYFFLDVIGGNVRSEEHPISTSVRKIARNVQDIFALYKFLPEDYNLNFKKEKQRVYDNAEIIIKEID